MTFKGKWRNQYGSILDIEDEKDNRIVGRFTTALEDSGFFGQEIRVAGFSQGDCIGVSGGGRTSAGDSLVTYTGIVRGGRLETLWYLVSDAALVANAEGDPAEIKKLAWWRAMSTGADTFEREE